MKSPIWPNVCWERRSGASRRVCESPEGSAPRSVLDTLGRFRTPLDATDAPRRSWTLLDALGRSWRTPLDAPSRSWTLQDAVGRSWTLLARRSWTLPDATRTLHTLPMLLDAPGRSQTLADAPRRSWTLSDAPGWSRRRSWTLLDAPGRSQTLPDAPGRSQRVLDTPRRSRATVPSWDPRRTGAGCPRPCQCQLTFSCKTCIF